MPLFFKETMNTNWAVLDAIPLPELNSPDIEMLVRDIIADPNLVVWPIWLVQDGDSVSLLTFTSEKILTAWRRAARALPELRSKSIPCRYL